MSDIGFDKSHVLQAGRGCASPGAMDGARLTLDRHDLSGGTDEPAQKHGHIPDARAKIKNALAKANSSLAKEILGNRSEPYGLAD